MDMRDPTGRTPPNDYFIAQTPGVDAGFYNGLIFGVALTASAIALALGIFHLLV